MSPVVVVKDYGGYVDQYAAITETYRRTGREVRIHECHSACTMALSLPNVCVYRDSVFKFHQAYDPRNHVTNYAVSNQLFATYPEAVRDRLGTLTKQFTIIRGQELIDLGVRDCTAPEPRIMMAQARVRPLPDGMTTGSSTLSMLTGKLQGMVPSLGAKPEPVSPPGAKPRYAPNVPDGMLEAKIPLPPERPVEIATAAPGAPDQATPTEPAPHAPDEVTAAPSDGIPLPPPRPKVLVALVPALKPIPYLQRIAGSATILPARFIPFPRHPA